MKKRSFLRPSISFVKWHQKTPIDNFVVALNHRSSFLSIIKLTNFRLGHSIQYWNRKNMTIIPSARIYFKEGNFTLHKVVQCLFCGLQKKIVNKTAYSSHCLPSDIVRWSSYPACKLKVLLLLLDAWPHSRYFVFFSTFKWSLSNGGG